MRKRSILVLFFISLCIFSVTPASAQESGPIYIIQPGDSLSRIAERFNVSLTELMEANGITNANAIFAGQQLVIPGLEGVSGILQTEVINFGDSYLGLMRKTQVPELLFRQLNRIISPSQFYVGRDMILPTDEDGQDMNTRLTLGAGESLLEAAVRQNSDPWTISSINYLNGTWDGLPGDTLFAAGDENGETITGLPPAFRSAEIRDLPIKQGGTGVIRVSTEPGVTLSGLLIDHQLHFFPREDGSYVALQGVHALLEPGVYPLRIDATLPDGSIQSYEQLIVIETGDYPEDPLLYVDPATIDPAATEPEQKQLLALVAEATPEKRWTGDFGSPASLYAESTYFTSRYGNRRTYIGQGTELKVEGFHTGLDFGGGVGLPITSPAAGRVVFASPWTVRGNATVIDHGWGVYSGFWHQSKFNVQAGDVVDQGQVIGEVGGTGRVTGAHLHWELWVNGVQVDPLDWLTQAYP